MFKFIAYTTATFLIASACDAAKVRINPSKQRQTVTFGADVKLTLRRVDEGNTEQAIDRFVELGY